MRLDHISYQLIGQNVRVIGYPKNYAA